METDQPDLDTIERADRENKERLIRNIVNATEGLTINDHIALKILISQNQTLCSLYNCGLMSRR